MAPPGLVTLHVWRVRWPAVPRAWWLLTTGARRLRAVPGVRFGKLLGTGRGRTFTPTDADPTRYATLIAWRDAESAGRFAGSPLGRAWSRIADAQVRLDLRPSGSRGRWSGQEPFGPPFGPPVHGPVLALTRARLRPSRAVEFWRAVPPVAAALADAPGLLARFGIGEAPIGWQGTVSVWRDTAHLVEFAYRLPQHRAAVARTPVRGWYAEELFTRFSVLDIVGDPAVVGWAMAERHRGGREREECDGQA